MNELEWLKSLDRAVPAHRAVDVTEGVMQAVRARSIAQENDRTFFIAAIVATAAGIAAAAIVAPAWFAPTDPFAGFGDAVNLVLR